MSLTRFAGQFAARSETEMLTVELSIFSDLRRRSVFDSRRSVFDSRFRVAAGAGAAARGAAATGAGAGGRTGAGAGRGAATGAGAVTGIGAGAGGGGGGAAARTRGAGGGGATGAGGGGASAGAAGAPARLNTSGTFSGTSAFGGAAAGFCCDTNIGAITCNGNATIVSPCVEAPDGNGLSHVRTVFHGSSIFPCLTPLPSSASGK